MAMDYQSEFYVTLPSNSEPDNKTGNFTVHLPRTIELGSSWEVALTDIVYPYTFVNFPEKIEKRDGNYTTTIYVSFRIGIVIYFDIARGQYNTIGDLTAAINEAMDHHISSFGRNTFENNETQALANGLTKLLGEKLSKMVKFKVNPYTKQVSVSIRKDLIDTVALSEHLGHMLGLESNYIKTAGSGKKSKWYLEKAIYSPSMKVGCESLYVYTDLIEPQLVGNTYAPLLKIVHVEGKFGNSIEKVFYNRHYIPVCVKTFGQIHVDIKDSANQYIEFDSGKCILTLHFRKQTSL